MALSVFVFSGLILFLELVTSVEHACRDEKVFCYCGLSDTTFSVSCIDEHLSESLCEAYEHCETCENDVAHCVTCPAGYFGPFCDQEEHSGSWPHTAHSSGSDETESPLVPRDLSCPELRSPKLGSISCWYRGYEKECTGSCLPGHSFETRVKEIRLVCQSGVWMPYSSFPQCISEGYCKFDLTGGGSYNCTTGGRGTYCDITCYSHGYKPVAGRYFCYPGGSWDPPLPHCARETAAEGTGRDGQPVCECQNGGSCNSRNQQCTCPLGFKGRLCQTKERDTRRYCSHPDQLQNGEVKNTDGSIVTRNQQFYEGLSVVYSCHSEFALVGESLLTCTKYGTWSNSAPKCNSLQAPKTVSTDERLIYCGDPGVDPNGIKTVSPWISPRSSNSNSKEVEYPQGTQIDYSCKEGYNLQGESFIVCLFSGYWSSPTPKCHPAPASIIQVRYCENPGDIRNGRKTVVAFLDPRTKKKVLDDSADLPEGVKLVFSCNPGFSIRGSAVIECVSTGTWSNPVPTCEKEEIRGCGHSYYAMAGKILNGEKTVEGEWPWQVAYAENRRTGMFVKCGAVLIDHRTALTAAHCVAPRRLDKTFLYFGKYYADFTQDDDQVLSRKATEFIVHPRYNRRNMDNDIALVRFAPEIPYTTRIQPICLPTRGTAEQNLEDGIKGWVTGWGTTENGTYSTILLMAQIPVVSTTRCRDVYKRLNLAVQITNNMYCAGYQNGDVDSCGGDSGGPMVFYNRLTESYVLEGIVSFGVRGPNGDCGQRDRYGVYAKVSNYVPWIKQYT